MLGSPTCYDMDGVGNVQYGWGRLWYGLDGSNRWGMGDIGMKWQMLMEVGVEDINKVEGGGYGWTEGGRYGWGLGMWMEDLE